MKPAVRNVLLIALALLFALFVWPTAYEYGKSGRLPERRNRFTGTIEEYYGGGWHRQ